MFAYFFVRLSILCFKIVPFSLLYKVSWLFYILTYYALRIRRKQVFRSLLLSFPEKSKKELKIIEKKIYQNMSHVFFENIKAFSLSSKDLIKRVRYKNSECVLNYMEEQKSCILYFSHYCNWEWLATLGSAFPKRGVALFKRIHNNHVNKCILNQRESLGLSLVPQKKFLRFLNENIRKKNDQMNSKAFLMLSDQRPRASQDAITLDFLNQKTQFLLGPEKIAKRYKMPIVYLHMTRAKLGYYDVKFIPFGIPEENKPLGNLTKRLVKELENQIKKEPQDWFWMHNRWK